MAMRVPFEPLSRTSYGRYRLLWATELMAELIERNWIEGPIVVDRDLVREHIHTLVEEHGFNHPPPREDTIDISLALIMLKMPDGVKDEQERVVRGLLELAYDESDRFG